MIQQLWGLLPAAGIVWVCVSSFGVAAFAQEPVPIYDSKPGAVQLGQERGTLAVAGTISDASGAALSGVEIIVLNLDTNSKRETTTDDSGHFLVANLPPGRYRVRAEVPGFSAQEKEVTISPNSVNAVNMALGWPGEQVPLADRKTTKPEITGRASSHELAENAAAPQESRSESQSPNAGRLEPPTTEVVQLTQSDEIALQQWLNEQSLKHRQVLAMVTLDVRSSLAVLRAVPSDTKIEYLAVMVSHSLRANDLEKRLRSQPNLYLIGIHKITSNSYIMVFGRG